MMFVEVAIKHNNMVVIVDTESDIIYITQQAVIHTKYGHVEGGSYEKVCLLPFLIKGGKQSSDFYYDEYGNSMMRVTRPDDRILPTKKLTGHGSLSATSYEELKPDLVKLGITGEWHAQHSDNETFRREGKENWLESHISNFIKAPFAKEFGLTEDDVRNVRYVRYDPNAKKSVKKN